MKPVIIFGLGNIAEVIHYCITNETDLKTAAFTVDKEFIKEEEFLGFKVIPFESIKEKYPPADYDMFVALGYHQLNKVREEKVYEAKVKGYNMISVISKNSGIPANLDIGENCFIMNNVCVHPKVKIGNNVFIWSGAVVGHHSDIGDNCWLTSGANIAGCVKIGKNCFFAINSTVGDNVSIGNDCFIGANTLVTKNLADEKVVIQESTKEFRLNSKQFLKMFKSFY
ncbi:MAG: acetyltransferase [Ignavibacteriae bacterium]|nr:acetyltransferase [Ignavibacteriota bacterium]